MLDALILIIRAEAEVRREYDFFVCFFLNYRHVTLFFNITNDFNNYTLGVIRYKVCSAFSPCLANSFVASNSQSGDDSLSKTYSAQSPNKLAMSSSLTALGGPANKLRLKFIPSNR